MTAGIRSLKPLFGVVLAGLLACQASSAEARQTIPEDEFTLARVKSLFDAAMLNPEIDEDDDIRLVEEGVITFVRLDPERRIITYFSLWELKADASELAKLRLVNNLNDNLIFVRFCMPDETTLWCDYQVSYSGGISGYAVVNNYREFRRVTVGAVLLHDPDDLIGSD